MGMAESGSYSREVWKRAVWAFRRLCPFRSRWKVVQILLFHEKGTVRNLGEDVQLVLMAV